MTALYFVGKAYNTNDKDKSYNNVLAPSQVKTLSTGGKHSASPTLDKQLEVRTAENKLYYTFSWTQTTDGTTLDTTEQKYTIELYGVQADGKQETIRLASDVDLARKSRLTAQRAATRWNSAWTYDLAEGSKSWKYNNTHSPCGPRIRHERADRPGGRAELRRQDPAGCPRRPGGFTRLYDEKQRRCTDIHASTGLRSWVRIITPCTPSARTPMTLGKPWRPGRISQAPRPKSTWSSTRAKKLRFYVIANRAAGDTTGFDSPDGALCDPQAVKSRVAARDGEQCGLCPGCAQPGGVPESRNAANDGQRQHGQQLLLYRLSV